MSHEVKKQEKWIHVPCPHKDTDGNDIMVRIHNTIKNVTSSGAEYIVTADTESGLLDKIATSYDYNADKKAYENIVFKSKSDVRTLGLQEISIKGI